MTLSHSFARIRPSLSFILLLALLLVLWLAGGASRGDVAGQAIVRAAAWIAILTATLFARPASLRIAPMPGLLLLAAVTLALLQLIPLPPALWLSLPGREIIAEAPTAVGTDIWRPWSISPSATINAACSLVVPAAVLLLMAGMYDWERTWIAAALLGLAVLSFAIGLMQFSGGGFDNPFVNDTPGEVGGPFANRNHFALFLALVCIIAPVWSLLAGKRWLMFIAAGLTMVAALTILVTGSRAGVGLGALALILVPLLLRRELQHLARRAPRWRLPAALLALTGVVAAIVLSSIVAGRAVSIDRLLVADPGADMRSRGLGTVLTMIATYFPAGSGLGGFDMLFRRHEPDTLLKPTYFNHVHNDFLEVVLQAGLPGLILLVVGLAWWLRASIAAWQAGALLPKLGSAILLLVILSSVVDYPARTPLIMAITMIAAVWLAERPKAAGA